MTLDDPFFVVKEEVCKALNKTRGLYLRWSNLKHQYNEFQNCINFVDELEWTNTELKNCLRSIEWDLEDLDDTIEIVEKNPTKFKIQNRDVTTRKLFIDTARQEVKVMRDHLVSLKDPVNQSSHIYNDSSQAALIKTNNNSNNNQYLKLENCGADQEDCSPQHFKQKSFDDQEVAKKLAKKQQHLDAINESLRSHSKCITVDLEEQSGMLLNDDCDYIENSTTSSSGFGQRLYEDSNLRTFITVLHLSNVRRQWIAIFLLSFILLAVLFLLYFLP